MNRFETEPSARALAEELADGLVKSGDITDLRWRDIFAGVPRHVFVPHFALTTLTPAGTRYDLVSSDTPERREEWLGGVYSPETLLTQVEGQPVEQIFAGGSGYGRHSSSSTHPGLMAWMLETLDLHDGHRVLEIGTGTGYNAALLSDRLGSEGVTTIDIDEQLTSLARERLTRIGLHPTVVTGDGRGGHRPNAPYDRVISTCGLAYVPPAWIEQTKPGGLILTNVTGLIGGAMLLAQVEKDGTASGRFLPRWAGFMPSRHPKPKNAEYADGAVSGRTSLDPDVLSDPGFKFLAQLYLPGARRYWSTHDGRDLTGVSVADGSWADIYEPGPDGTREVKQAGPRRLWDCLEEAHRWWQESGKPDWSHFEFAASPGRQMVVLGDRGWPLPVEDLA